MKNVLYVIAIIGGIYFLSKVIESYINYNNIHKYYINCERVKVGMTLNEARIIVENLKDRTHVHGSKNSKITINRDPDNNIIYRLEYPYEFAQSENMRFKFDPITLRILEISCGE